MWNGGCTPGFGAVVLTLLSAWLNDARLHGAARFIIGWASGCAMVLVAAWSNERLQQLGRPGLSAAVFAGPHRHFPQRPAGGAAERLAGHGGDRPLAYGALALLLIAPIAVNLPRRGELHRPETAPAPLVLDGNLKRLVLSYSLAGFGYILPATFLSQLAATRFPHSLFAQFVWPVFGGAAVIGIALGILTAAGPPPICGWRWRCGRRRSAYLSAACCPASADWRRRAADRRRLSAWCN